LQLFRESLALQRDLDARPGVADCFEGLAQAAQKLGNEELGAMLFGAGEKLREELGMPMLPYNRAGYQASRTATLASLGEDGFRDAWQRGSSTSIERLCRLVQNS
jgi:hypothetical protein